MKDRTAGRTSVWVRWTVTALVAAVTALAPQQAATQTVTAQDYARAEQYLPWNAARFVSGDQVAPHFFDGDRFWFRSHAGEGHEFVVVDPAAPSRRLAFDHHALAAALSVAADTTYVGHKLPFTEFEFTDGERAIRFHLADSVRWTCDIRAYVCTGPDTEPKPPTWQRTSPDGRWVAWEQDENLWVRATETGDTIQLSQDGEKDYGYAVVPEGCCQEITNRRFGVRLPPVLTWSPDSRRIAAHRYDEREVERLHLLEARTGRPKLHSYAYALPGDSVVPTVEGWIFDVESRSQVRVDVPEQPGYFTTGDTIWRDVQWTDDGDELFYTTRSRDFKTYGLHRVNAETGAAATILEETSKTFVELNQFTGLAPAWRVLGDGDEFLWWSERDGWGHLYLYDGQGNLKNRVTSGPWLVVDVVHVDEAARTVYFMGAGREEGHPYLMRLYRVGLDGAGLRLLTPEPATHMVTVSPSGRYFVDQYSRPDTLPVTVVRTTDGSVRQTVEQGALTEGAGDPWQWPTLFEARGRDGITPVYGLLSFPSDFDPDKTYPVIDYIYPGPQIGAVTTYVYGAADRGNQQALAELGFIVFAVDAFGSPLRSKAFHDAYYGNMGDNGIPDHIAAMQQLAQRHPQMDLTRVGIYGHSGGGFSSTDAILRWPDFFDVAVSGAGNHDNRGYLFAWAEKYQGLLEKNEAGGDNYDNQANQNLAANLKGKLLLHYGTLDDNVHPNMTLNVIQALIEANKDFDLFVIPNGNHGYASLANPTPTTIYPTRRTWDYFVEHLLGVEPPKEYMIRPPGR